jgi:hypothetical protein
VLTAQHRVGGVFSQAMLINRSPRLNHLDNEAFARLREQPATNAHQGELLFALQRARVGLVSVPATEAILGVVPKAKAGVGSAVNDATRLLGKHPRRSHGRQRLRLHI